MSTANTSSQRRTFSNLFSSTLSMTATSSKFLSSPVDTSEVSKNLASNDATQRKRNSSMYSAVKQQPCIRNSVSPQKEKRASVVQSEQALGVKSVPPRGQSLIKPDPPLPSPKALSPKPSRKQPTLNINRTSSPIQSEPTNKPGKKSPVRNGHSPVLRNHSDDISRRAESPLTRAQRPESPPKKAVVDAATRQQMLETVICELNNTIAIQRNRLDFTALQLAAKDFLIAELQNSQKPVVQSTAQEEIQKVELEQKEHEATLEFKDGMIADLQAQLRAKDVQLQEVHVELTRQRAENEMLQADDLESLCSRISNIAHKPAPPPKSPWRFAIRRGTVILNVELSSETEFITKFEIRRENESIMIQEPADVYGSDLKVRTFAIQLASYMRELSKAYGKLSFFVGWFLLKGGDF
ncbi:hypothetical protein HDU81_004595 [Chytriomyces hyalinus]|nr:hypothetical protein HDU81_004595 [Chytriomyces hyalinus]